MTTEIPQLLHVPSSSQSYAAALSPTHLQPFDSCVANPAAPPSPATASASSGGLTLLQSLLVDRTLSRHRVVDIDMLPPPPTGLCQGGEEQALDVVGGHSRRCTWNPAAAAAAALAPNGTVSPVPSHHARALTSVSSAHGRGTGSRSPTSARGGSINVHGRPMSLSGAGAFGLGISAMAMAAAAAGTGAGLVVDEMAAAALSPRQTARMTQTASILATLDARQQQLNQQQQSSAGGAAVRGPLKKHHSTSASSSHGGGGGSSSEEFSPNGV